MFIRRTEFVIEISDTKLEGFEEIADAEFQKIMLDGIDDPDIAEAIAETLLPQESDIVDLAPPPEPDLDRIRDEYTVAELKKLATAHGISGRSKMNQDALIDALLESGVAL